MRVSTSRAISSLLAMGGRTAVFLSLHCVVFSLVLAGGGVLAVADEYEEQLGQWKRQFERRILPILQSHCIDCHNEVSPEGELNLEKFADGEAAADALDAWERVARRVRLNEMPPQGAPGLNDRQKATFHRWVDSRPNQDLCRQLASDETQSWYRGFVMSRRLTHLEYRNAMRDLLGVELLPHELPPADGAGGEGFDTVGDALFTSTIHLETYLSAADRAIELVLADPWDEQQLRGLGIEGAELEAIEAARERILSALPSTQWEKLQEISEQEISESADGDSSEESLAAARTILAAFGRLAWRRPLESDELDRLLTLYQSARDREQPFLVSVREPMKAVLVSPHFLFLVESEPEDWEGGVMRLSPYQLATRVALLVWSSVPDEPLLSLAESEALYEPEVLRGEIRRMLQDPRARAIGENFGLQWLNLRNFTATAQPDVEVFPEFDRDLAERMRDEVVDFVAGVFRDNRPLTELLDADYTYADGRLARHYGLDLPEEAPWQRVAFEDRQRGGLITMGGVLTATSYPRRTSPVLRGRWILEELLGSRVPPPPPGVPELEEEEGHDQNLTLRQRLEVHRQKAECASCHDRMDPLGFGLENFDAIGRWRLEDEGHPVDAAGTLPSGEEFTGPEELKAVMLNRQDEFRKHLVRKMLGFALGRPLNKFDECVVDETLKSLSQNEDSAAVLLEEIALSYPFQHRYYKKADPPREPRRRGISQRVRDALKK